MAEIAVVTDKGQGGDNHFWEEVGTADEGAVVKLPLSGWYALMANGNFAGSADIAFQFSPDGVSYFEIPDASFTAAGLLIVKLPAGYLKPVMGSGNGTTDVDAWAQFAGR